MRSPRWRTTAPADGITREAAAQERYRGNGPKFFKRGRSVFYRWADIYAHEAAISQERTGERASA